jgi:glutamyl-tRNA synthetase
MAISHVIRGDDHLTNAARQAQLYHALGWSLPRFAHIPLIHGPDGAKLSKRHGALGAEAYRDMGYLPEAMRNYLLRLGWAHGDDEIIPTGQAVEWFSLEAIGRSPARFDLAKLNSLNGHYIREADDPRLVVEIEALRARRGDPPLDPELRERLAKAMPGLKQRVKTLVELDDLASFIFQVRPLTLDPKAAALLTPEARGVLARLYGVLEQASEWNAQALEARIRDFVAAEGHSLGAVAQPLRAALAGRTVSPPIFDVLYALGRGESLARIFDIATMSADLGSDAPPQH